MIMSLSRDPLVECTYHLLSSGVRGNVTFRHGAFHVDLHQSSIEPSHFLWNGIPVYYQRAPNREDIRLMDRQAMLESLTRDEVIAAAHRLGLHDDGVLHVECAACLRDGARDYAAALPGAVMDRAEFQQWLEQKLLERKEYLHLQLPPADLYDYWKTVSEC